MEKEENIIVDEKLGREPLDEKIKEVSKKFLEKTKDREILIISHFDTDGITSASIIIQALKRIDRKFSVKIVKSLEEDFIRGLPKDKVILFLDLASGSLDYMKDENLKDVFIIDHHEVTQEIPEGVEVINPWFNGKEKISGAGLSYLFSKEIDNNNKDLAKLAVLGMMGDIMEKHIEDLDKEIFDGGDIKRKKGLLLYPSTRPINKTLEYSSNPYIPGVTGNSEGVFELIRETGIEMVNGKHKSLIELSEDEMKKLTTAIMLRNPNTKRDIIGNIYLLKFFNKLDDARELSAMINACSRLGKSEAALKFCLEVPNARKEAEGIHAKYKQHLISALDFVSKTEKIEGKGFVIINAGDQVMDTIIGTIASILSNSPNYEEGTIITAMAYYEGKIKISARICGQENNGRNVKEILEKIITQIGGEVGGHEFAAGGIIEKEKEKDFIEALKKNLEIEMVKI
ncbi:MAG: DHH family phosphoesterase [Candidatus Pacearchaeota archaeon]